MIKVLCKKNYKRKYPDSDIINHLTKEKWYEVLGQSGDFYRVISDCKDYGELAVSCEFFYTISELRKIKLSKLKNEY